MANKKGILRVAPEKKLRVCVTFRITAGEYKYLEGRGLNVNVLAASLLRRHIEAAKRADQRKQVNPINEVLEYLPKEDLLKVIKTMNEIVKIELEK